jgi:hypothetical protein
MGRLAAEDMIQQTDLKTALRWHLLSNHYPPVPESMIQPCLDAIEKAYQDHWGDASLSDLIELPEGISWRGESSAPAYAIIEAHHLDAFIDLEGDQE